MSRMDTLPVERCRRLASAVPWRMLRQSLVLVQVFLCVCAWNSRAQTQPTVNTTTSQPTAAVSPRTDQPGRVLPPMKSSSTNIPTPVHASSPTGNRTAAAVTLVKDALNAVFFVVVGIITILTYRRAKRTILQPLRTEIFKQQIQLFSDLLKIFVGKSESDLREQFAFERMLRANVQFQCDLFLRVQFGAVVDESQRLYNRTQCPTSEFVIGVDEMPDEPPVDGVINVPVMPRTWAEHVPREVRIPLEHIQMRDKIGEFLESPLTPKELAAHLEALLALLSKNIDHVRAALSAYVPQMPKLCPTVEHRTRLTTTPAHNFLFQRFEPLKPVADDIVGYIRSYFAVENLMKDD
jgi:hypothetical protein